MNKIEQMVKEMCPGGGEKVKLIHYCNVLYGFPFESQYFSEDSSLMPIIRIRDVVPGVASTYYSGAFAQEYVVKKGDVLVGMDGNFNLAKWNDRDGLLNQRVCKLYTKNDNMLIDGFVYHFMKPEFKRIELNTPGGSVKHLSAKIINSIEIPLPPLPIQEAIVEILDKFESLHQGLQDELQSRKKQYEYYRNKLLGFSFFGGEEHLNKIEQMVKEMCPRGVESRKWGDCVQVITAPKKLKTNEYLEIGQYPVIDQGQKFIVGYSNDIPAVRSSPAQPFCP